VEKEGFSMHKLSPDTKFETLLKRKLALDNFAAICKINSSK
jgi:hypothetical protein